MTTHPDYCTCGHTRGQHELRAGGRLGCQILGCTCTDHTEPEAGPSWPPTPAAAAPYWDRFDICLAWQHFAAAWHGGQWSPEYRIFGRLEDLKFRAGLAGDRLTRGPEGHANARDILANLIRRQRAGLEIIRDA